MGVYFLSLLAQTGRQLRLYAEALRLCFDFYPNA